MSAGQDPRHWWNRWGESSPPEAPGETPPEHHAEEVAVSASVWWGVHRVAAGGHLHLRLGPLDLTVQRDPQEWHIAWSRDDTLEDVGGVAALDLLDHPPETQPNLERFVFRTAPEWLALSPRLADRPVVSRPFAPLHIPAGEEVTVFISSPLWIALEVGQPGRLLKEIPIVRPSDTWFGTSTREGEICYASRTRATLALDPAQRHPQRATIPTLVRNESDQEMLLERINLPVPLLSLFADADGRLWSQALTLVREEDGELASLHIGKGAPRQAGHATLVSPARQQSNHPMLARAFSALFG